MVFLWFDGIWECTLGRASAGVSSTFSGMLDPGLVASAVERRAAWTGSILPLHSVQAASAPTLNVFENAGSAHAAADAHCDHAVTGVAAFQLADHGGGQFGAGA